MRAAISAAPTKKLTSSAPHAGVRRRAPRGTSGLAARRTCQVKAAAATSGAEEVPPAAGREDLDLGVGGREGEDHPAEGGGEQQGADQVGLDAARDPAAQVEQRAGREPAPGQQQHERDDGRWRRSGSASGRRRRTGRRAGPTSGRASVGRGAGRRWPPPRRSRAAAGGRRGPGGTGSRGPCCGRDRGARPRIAAARTSPTARLIAKIARQSATARTAAPKSGPSTEPISCTAETTPSGTPRRSTG